jgi:hypothetical protein
VVRGEDVLSGLPPWTRVSQVPVFTWLANWFQAAVLICRTGPVRFLVSRMAIRGPA